MNHNEKIHNEDWEKVKEDYSFFEKESRFEILKNLILSDQLRLVTRR